MTAAVSLIHALVNRNPDEYKGCITLAVSRLSRIVTSSYTDLQDYTYYFVPAPWLSVKLLRLLQNYPPPEDAGVRGRLNECLEVILNKAQEPLKSKKVQHSNAKNAILFEAISLIIHMDNEPNLLVRACNQLGQFLQHRETNLRYLALESMCLLATSEFSHEAVKKHQDTVINALKTERDVSVRQRAVDLLYAMCDKTNSEEIVAEMLAYLETADYSIREEMVLKVAILAEKYASDYTWYVDVILNLIRIAGDYVSEEVWYRVIQIVINREDVQGYAAKTVFEALQAPACHENMVKVAGYILGEFGNLIAGDARSTPIIQFQLLNSKYHLCSTATRALLLTTYVKFINLFPEIKTDIQTVFNNHTNIRSADAELQQRTVEYLQLSTITSQEILATVLEEMPPFAERESNILATLKKKKPGMTAADKLVRENSTGTKTAANSAIAKVAEMSNDLLGLSSSAPAPVAAPPSNTNLLVDLFGDPVPDASAAPVNGNGLDMMAGGGGGAPTVIHSNEECLSKLLCKANGVVYESSIIQVGLKCEYKQNLGKVIVFYGNKTTAKFVQFTASVSLPYPLDTGLLCLPLTIFWLLILLPFIHTVLSILTKPTETAIEPTAQIQQQLNIECIDHFSQYPQLTIQFMSNNTPQKLVLQLPITINKFFEPTVMNSENFFQRWKNLNK